ncbi:unnamed protein product [Paramecium pentaurelia]|uniref:Uncharacterized protein n=1 Tax=Paramecium pentaurelia TaxID=43138 RepID=A0A8S1V455_9CILI|nr:unnamed protein product [Paramecium pentaurelia]
MHTSLEIEKKFVKSTNQRLQEIDDKYLCTRCLAERVDKENMALLNDATEMIQSMKTQSLKLAKEENVLRLTNLRQLQSSIKSFKNQVKTDQQMQQIQIDIELKEQKLEIKNYDEEIQILSKIIQEILVKISLNSKHIRKKTRSLCNQSMNHYNLSQNHKIISKQLNPQIQLDLVYQSINRQKSMKYLPKNLINIMLILLNLNLVDWHVQNVFKKILFNILVQKKQIIFGILLQDNQKIQFQNIILEEKKHLKWLKKKLNNQKIIIIIHYQKCCRQQMNSQQNKKEFQTSLNQKINRFLNQMKNKLRKLLIYQVNKIKINIFYSNRRSKIDLINYFIKMSNQNQKPLSSMIYFANLGNGADIQITPEIHKFISKCQLQEQYLQIYNESVDLQIELQKEAQQLEQKGQLEQFIQFEVKNDTDDVKSSFLQQQYKQFEINSEKMRKLINSDENEQQLLLNTKQKEELKLKIDEEKLEIKQIQQKIIDLEENINQKLLKQEQEFAQQCSQETIQNNQLKQNLMELSQSNEIKLEQLITKYNELNQQINEVQTDLKEKEKSTTVKNKLQSLKIIQKHNSQQLIKTSKS